MHKIKLVEPYGIAQEMGVEPGDILLTINGQKISDVLDYRFMIQEEDLIIEVEKQSGEIWELEIEKDEESDIGLIFESDLMDDVRTCRNKCIFCFMDQLPKGMRPSLYVKDDDPRLSFLSGNYVTLTNLSETEANRLAHYHLSPLHISVHATDPHLRRKMLNNRKAGDLFTYINKFSAVGIVMHFQIVLCKNINDGAALDDTIGALLPVGDSLSVVPAGLTKYRDNLTHLEPFTQEDAIEVIEQVEKWRLGNSQKKARVYCADEWYIKAKLPMPPYEYYDDFPQLENGVGMWASFAREFEEKFLPGTAIVTGQAAKALMENYGKKYSSNVYDVKNDFFGHTITVSGLLTGHDIVTQVKDRARRDKCTGLYLPKNMFRAGTDCTLDDMTIEEIEREIGLPIYIL